MAVSTPGEFFSVLEKSRLLSAESLQDARDATSDLTNAKDVARALIKQDRLTKWQARNLLSGRSVLKLGTHQLLSQLGAGTTGVVYLAECAESGRRSALKVLSRKLTAQGELLKAFAEKMKKAKTIDHPGVAQLRDVKKEGGVIYLLMEDVDGKDLKQQVESDGPLDPAIAAQYIQRAAEGLAAVHAEGLVHADVKPSHLMVDAADAVKVIGLTSAALAPETDPDFVSPEAASGETVDAGGDIYSLGCTLYFLLVGQPPFPTGSPDEKRKQHQEETPPGLLAKRLDVPARLAKICGRMMVKSADSRIGSAAAVAESLEKWLAEAGGEPAGDDSSSEKDASDVDAALADALAAGEFDEALDSAAEESPADRSASDAFSSDVSSAFDDALAEALAASEFDDALADEDKPGAKKKKPLYTADDGAAAKSADDDLAPAPVAPSKDVKKATADSPEKMDETADGEPQNFLGIDLEKIGLGGPNAKKKQIIAGGAIGGIVLLLLVWMYVLPMFSDKEKTAQRGSSRTRRPVKKDVVDQKQKTDDADDAAPGDPDADDTATDDAAADDASADDATDRDDAGVDDATDDAAATDDGDTDDTSADDTTTDDATTDDTATDDATADDATTDDAVDDSDDTSDDGDDAATPAGENPLLALGPHLKLPDVASADPMVVGSVELPADTDLGVELLGGVSVSPGLVFAVKQPEAGESSWVVTATKGGTELSVANLTFSENQLTFQWHTQYSANPFITPVCNCLLQLRAGDAEHVVALREPKKNDPFLVNLKMEEMKIDQPLAGPPAADLLRVELTGLNDAFPEHTIDPSEMFAAHGGRTKIAFSDRDGPLISMLVESVVDTGVTLKITSFFSLSRTYVATGDPSQPTVDARYRDETMKLYFGRVNRALQDHQEKLALAESRLADAKGATKESLRERKALLESEIEVIKRDQAKLKRLADLAAAIHEKGEISYRVFAVIDDHAIDLVRAGEPAAVDAPN